MPPWNVASRPARPPRKAPAQARAQRQEDLHFHDVLAAVNPNGLLRFMCELINQLLHHQVAMGHTSTHPAYQRLGNANAAAHARLLASARRRDDRARLYGYHWYIGDILASTPPQPYHWVKGIGWGGHRLIAFPALGLVVAMNCGKYNRSGMEQTRVVNMIIKDVVLPSFV